MIDSKKFLNGFIDHQSIKLISVLGTGSYGVVYLGQYVYTKKYYAVKCVPYNSISRNEIEIHSILTGHPNILSLEKVIHEFNHVFFVMEYATHGDLFTTITQPHLAKDIIGKTKVIRHLFLQILDAVQYCHSNSIAHRDLKPENILLLSNHRIKLSDFGLATTQTLSKQFNCGSSFYFSPECQGISCQGNKTIEFYNTMANDVWSLGIILINLVSGRNPWKQANMQDPAFLNFLNQPRRFFQTILPGISKGLDQILTQIFTPNPTQRLSLTELRQMILSCRSFTAEIGSIDLKCSESFQTTMLAYVGDYVDDPSLSLSFTQASNSLSSVNTTDSPLTPVTHPSQLHHDLFKHQFHSTS